MSNVDTIEDAIAWLDVLAEYVDDEEDFADIQDVIRGLRRIVGNTED